jgi:hypothetical protein
MDDGDGSSFVNLSLSSVRRISCSLLLFSFDSDLFFRRLFFRLQENVPLLAALFWGRRTNLAPRGLSLRVPAAVSLAPGSPDTQIFTCGAHRFSPRHRAICRRSPCPFDSCFPIRYVDLALQSGFASLCAVQPVQSKKSSCWALFSSPIWEDQICSIFVFIW